MVNDNYNIEIDINNTWTSIEAIITTLQKTELLYNKLKPADSVFTFQITPKKTLYNQLSMIGTRNVAVRVLKNNNPYFHGYIRKTFDITATQRLEPMKIEIVTGSFLLKRKCRYNLMYQNKTVTHILDDLLKVANITFYQVPVINYMIPGLIIKDGEKTYHEIIEQMMYEYGYVFYFDELGVFRYYNLKTPENIFTTTTFDGTNTRERIVRHKKEEEIEAIHITWSPYKTLTNAIVFSDTSNAQSGYKCFIEIPPLGYLGDKEEWYAELDHPEGDIISVVSASLDIIKDTDIEVLKFQTIGKRVLLSIKNNNPAVSKFVRKLDIIAGTATISLPEKNVEKTERVPNTEKILKLESKYIYTKDAGENLLDILNNYYEYSDNIYKIKSKVNVAIGEYVEIDDSKIGKNKGRIFRKVSDEISGMYDYEIDAIDEFSPALIKISEAGYNKPPVVDVSVNVQKENHKLVLSSNVVKLNKDGTYYPAIVKVENKVITNNTTNPYEGVIKYYLNGTLIFISGPTYEFDWRGLILLPEDNLYPDDNLIIPLSLTEPGNFPGLSIFPSRSVYPSVNGEPNPPDVVSVRFEMWDNEQTKMLDTGNLTIIPDIAFKKTEIQDLVDVRVPTYLGVYQNEHPSIYAPGDYWIVYGETDTPIPRGIYKVKSDKTIERLSGDHTNDAPIFSELMPIILEIVSNPLYGTLQDYGDITYITNLATNSVFTNSLKVGAGNLDSTIITNGRIKTNLLDANEIVANAAYFEGDINAHSGIFRGSVLSGPLELNISPPGQPTTYTTNSKKLLAFNREINNNGVGFGLYNCSGTYGGQAIASIEFNIAGTGTRTYMQQTQTAYYVFSHNVWSSLHQMNIPYYQSWIVTWNGYVNKRNASLTLRNSVGTVIYTGSGLWWDSSTDWSQASSAKGNVVAFMSSPSSPPYPSVTMAAGDDTPTLGTGSVTFNAATFTYKLKNLPNYSVNLPSGTVYFESDGNGNFILKVKG